MSVSNGQRANAETFNNAYMSRTTNTDTIGTVDLLNAGSADINDVQAIINANIAAISANEIDITALFADKQDIVDKDQPNGYAGLDGSGKISSSALPTIVFEFQGVWNATTNTPTLIDGTGDTGDVFRVSVAGTQDLGSGSQDFAIGDWVTYNGTIWERSDFGGGAVGATTELDNLGTTAIDVPLLPDGFPNIGADGNPWNEGFFRALVLGKDGSTGIMTFFSGATQLSNMRANTNTDQSGTSAATIWRNESGGLKPLAIATRTGTGTTDSQGILLETGNQIGTGNSGNFGWTIGTAAGGVQGEFKSLKSGTPPVVGDIWTATNVDGSGYYATPLGTVILAATSSVKAYPSAVNYLYLLMTGNSVALTPGTWELVGSVRAGNGGTSPQYNFCNLLWTSANGADTGVAPASLTLDAGENNSLNIGGSATDNISRNEVGLDKASAIYTTGVNQTIFLVPRLAGNAIINATAQTTMYARKIKEI